MIIGYYLKIKTNRKLEQKLANYPNFYMLLENKFLEI